MKARITDPYTGDDMGEAAPLKGDASAIETGYDGTKPNPVYRGLPYATLVIHPDGGIASVRLKAGHLVTDEEKAERAKDIRKRQSRKKGPKATPAKPPKAEVRQVRDIPGAMAKLKASLLANSRKEP